MHLSVFKAEITKMNSQKPNMDIRCLMKCEKITQMQIAAELGYSSSGAVSNMLNRNNLKLDEFETERQTILNAIYSIRDRRKDKNND